MTFVPVNCPQKLLNLLLASPRTVATLTKESLPLQPRLRLSCSHHFWSHWMSVPPQLIWWLACRGSNPLPIYLWLSDMRYSRHSQSLGTWNWELQGSSCLLGPLTFGQWEREDTEKIQLSSPWMGWPYDMMAHMASLQNQISALWHLAEAS